MTTPVVDIVTGWFSKSLIDSTQTECTTHYACQNGFQGLPPRCVGREGFGEFVKFTWIHLVFPFCETGNMMVKTLLRPDHEVPLLSSPLTCLL
jgi:hypothetical protein